MVDYAVRGMALKLSFKVQINLQGTGTSYVLQLNVFGFEVRPWML